jgi:hypothetical protein
MLERLRKACCAVMATDDDANALVWG